MEILAEHMPEEMAVSVLLDKCSEYLNANPDERSLDDLGAGIYLVMSKMCAEKHGGFDKMRESKEAFMKMRAAFEHTQNKS